MYRKFTILILQRFILGILLTFILQIVGNLLFELQRNYSNMFLKGYPLAKELKLEYAYFLG